MKKLESIVLAVVGVVLLVLVIAYAIFAPRSVAHAPNLQAKNDASISQMEQIYPLVEAVNDSVNIKSTPIVSAAPTIQFVGPRENIPKDAPSQYGFWSFAVPVTGVISRSGQPLLSEFKWLKDNGWKSVVDLRVRNDHGEVADDSKLPGFNDLGFNYLHVEIIDGHAPTDDQAQQYLAFVTNPQNQPVHVHCRGGYGRAGTMIALYRYAVQGWPLDKAVAESRLFHGGISDAQLKWLTKYAESHPAGSFGK